MAFSVSYTYKIQDLYSGKLAKISKATDKFRKATTRARDATKKFSQGMLTAQNALGTVAGVIGGGAVLGQFNNFAKSMNKLEAVTLANKIQMEALRDTAKKLGATTQFSASQAAEGMTFLGMAGLNADKIMQAIPGTLQLAAAGGLDLASAADIATNILAQMGLEIQDLTRVNDNLALIQAKSNTNIIEAAEAFKNLGTTSSTVGFTLEQTAAMIGSMANAGLKGGEAGTLLRSALLRLVNPSNKAAKVMRKLRIDLRGFVTPDGKLKNFTKLLTLLEKKGATTGDIFNIFERQGARAILALQKKGGPAIDKLTKALERGSGTAAVMAKIMMKGLPGALLTFKSALESVNLALFEKGGLAGFIEKVLTKLTLFLRKLEAANPIILKTIAILGTMAVVGGPVLIFLGLMAGAMSGLFGIFATGSIVMTTLTATVTIFGSVLAFFLTPIGLLVGAFALLAGGLVYLGFTNKKVSAAFKRLWEVLKKAFLPVTVLLKGLKMLFNALAAGETSIGITSDAIDSITWAINALASVIDFVTAPLQLLFMIFESLMDLGVNKTFEILGETLKGVGNAILEFMLIPLEGVIKKVDEIAGFMSNLTSGVGGKIKSFIFGEETINDKKAGVSEGKTGVAANFSKAQQGTINGGINIKVSGPGKVSKANMETSFPGNLGFNMAGAG